MNLYLVKEGTEAMLVEATAEWNAKNFRCISTKQANTFTEQEIIINPILGKCTHQAPNAQRLSALYVKSKYFGFVKDKFCLLVPLADVYIKYPEPKRRSA